MKSANYQKGQLKHLKSLRVNDLQHDTKLNGFIFEVDGYQYFAHSDDFIIGDSIQYIIHNSAMYSPCCGREVNTDIMICPVCKEHV